MHYILLSKLHKVANGVTEVSPQTISTRKTCNAINLHTVNSLVLIFKND